MIQDIAPHRLRNEYDPAACPTPQSEVFCLQGGKLLVKPGAGRLVLPTVAEFAPDTAFTYLFAVDETAFFLAQAPAVLPEGYAFEELSALRTRGYGPKEKIFAAMTAKHLADWYRDTRFCGRCGGPMRHSATERAVACPACGYTAYPRIMPAVIVGVTNGDRLLLTKYRNGYRHNALIAGFTEIGETLEQTVAREVMEEAGVRVKNIRYYKSQPWGMPNDILVGFYCDVDGDDRIRMDENELGYAQWVQREEIVLQPDDFSLTNEMMTQFKQGLQ